MAVIVVVTVAILAQDKTRRLVRRLSPPCTTRDWWLPQEEKLAPCSKLKAEDSAPNSFPSDKVVPKEGTLEQKQTSSIRQGIRVDHQK